jgi:DNA-directed RNA polymerase specialized sigma subunit
LNVKISLNIEGTDAQSTKVAENRSLERLILDTRKGDSESKERLIQRFRPLMLSMAEKRSADTVAIGKYLEAGKEGLVAAANKYTPSVGPENFRIFALDFIEARMNRVDKGGGFFSRLLGLENK